MNYSKLLQLAKGWGNFTVDRIIIWRLRFVIWQSLNATLNPEAKADMMESCLFEHKCPKCGHVDSYTYDLLYHDMESMLMIQLYF